MTTATQSYSIGFNGRTERVDVVSVHMLRLLLPAAQITASLRSDNARYSVRELQIPDSLLINRNVPQEPVQTFLKLFSRETESPVPTILRSFHIFQYIGGDI